MFFGYAEKISSMIVSIDDLMIDTILIQLQNLYSMMLICTSRVQSVKKLK